MKKTGIAAFTEAGKALGRRLGQLLPGEILWYEKNLKDWCASCFAQADAIIFIGACGIAVRTIAPFLKSKTTDPAVLVIDEKGQFVISLLSGHLGGANEFAEEAAALLGATPVITTASDVNGKIAVDVFAKKNNLAIGSMADAKRIAAAILRGEPAGVYCSGRMEGELPPELEMVGASQMRNNENNREIPKHLIWISERIPGFDGGSIPAWEGGTVLHLIPRTVILGIGCRKDKAFGEIAHIADEVLKEAGVSPRALAAVASIDIKEQEPGILALCEKYGLPYVTFTAGELAAVQGNFHSSGFVKQTTGVDNVCERASLLAAGAGGRIIRGKYAKNGVTAALAVRDWSVSFEV